MPNLRDLPPLPVTLTVLKLEQLGCLRSLPKFHRVHGGQTLDGGDNCTSVLHKLKINGCHNIRSLGGFLREQLPCLSSLRIENCKELVSWPEEEGFRLSLLSLQKLSIRDCPKLMALPYGSILSLAMKRLFVHRCPNFPDSSFFAQMSEMKNLMRQEDVMVEKQCQDLGSCSEALKHTKSVDILEIRCISQEGDQSLCFCFQYDIVPVGRSKHTDFVSYRRVIITIMGCDSDDEDFSNTLLPALLYNHLHLCSSLKSLVIRGLPQAAFFPQGWAEEAFLPSNRSSLGQLMIWGSQMKSLPVDTMLCHMRHLQVLCLFVLPELTMPSLEEALQSLPSLRSLMIKKCAKLSLPNSGTRARGSDDKISPSSSSSITTPPLQFLFTDDVELLANSQFRGTYLTFLHDLAIGYSDIHYLPAAMDECLKSLRSLSLMNCRNLQELPPDFRTLIPSLEVFCVLDCPRLRCVPTMGMLSSLEVLAITRSPGPEDDDWTKLAHVRLIIMERRFVQGSYNDFQDLMAKGKLALVPS